MKDNLWKLLMNRYWKVLVLLVICLLGFSISHSFSSGQSWRQLNKFYSGASGLKEYQDVLEDYQKSIIYASDGSVYYESPYDSYEAYRDDYLTVVDRFPEDNTLSLRYMQMSNLFVFIAAATGFLLFFVDLKTGFNSLLFSLGVPRKKIYFRKVLLFVLCLLGTFILSEVFRYFFIFSQVPAMYLANISWYELLPSSLFMCIRILSFFFGGMILGEICGDWLTTAVASVVGYLVLKEGSYAAITILKSYTTEISLEWHNPIQLNFGLYRGFFFVPDYVKFPWQTAICFIVIALVCYILGKIIYQRLTLEEDGKFIMLPWLRLPCLIFFTCMIIFAFSTTFINTYDYHGLVNYWLRIRNFIFVFGAAFLGSFFCIYRRLPFQAKILKWWRQRKTKL